MIYRICSLFAGVGGIDLAFEQAGCKTIWANDNDKDANCTYRMNFPDVVLDSRNIQEISPDDIPAFDILVGGFPCQPFSSAGREEGFRDERGNLFFEICRILDAKKPMALFLENVANIVHHDNGHTFRIVKESLKSCGYTILWSVANCRDYGFPQNRNRVYIIGFRDSTIAGGFNMPQKQVLLTTINDYIDRRWKAPKRYYLKPGTWQYEKLSKIDLDTCELYRFTDGKYATENGILKSNDSIAFTLLAGMGTWPDRVPIILDYYGIRRLTPAECFMLQGFPVSFKLPNIPEKSAYKQAGNTVCVPVVKQFAESVVKALNMACSCTPQGVMTLVGTLRNEEQLKICLENKFYYFPLKEFSGNLRNLRYIALYISRKISGVAGRIGYVGAVSDYTIVNRNQITEIPRQSYEKYCRVDISEWILYRGSICPNITKGVFLSDIMDCEIKQLLKEGIENG